VRGATASPTTQTWPALDERAARSPLPRAPSSSLFTCQRSCNPFKERTSALRDPPRCTV